MRKQLQPGIGQWTVNQADQPIAKSGLQLWQHLGKLAAPAADANRSALQQLRKSCSSVVAMAWRYTPATRFESAAGLDIQRGGKVESHVCPSNIQRPPAAKAWVAVAMASAHDIEFLLVNRYRACTAYKFHR